MPGVFGVIGGAGAEAAWATLCARLPPAASHALPRGRVGVVGRPGEGEALAAEVGEWKVLLEGRAEGVGGAREVAAMLAEGPSGTDRSSPATPLSLGGLDGWHSGVAARGEVTTIFTGFLALAPLFWTEHDGSLLFAPTLEALLAVAPRPLDLEVCRDVVELGHPLGTDTLHQGIHVLGPGTVLHHDGAGVELREVPRPALPCGAAELEDWLHETWPHLVRRCLDRPGRVGALLSGGLDSRAVVLASPTSLPTFTFGRAGTLDVQLAAEVARRLGHAHAVLPLPDDALVRTAESLVARCSGMVNPCHAPGAATNHAVAASVDHLLSGSFGDILMGSTAAALPPDSSDLACLRATLRPLRPEYQEALLSEPRDLDARLVPHLDPALAELPPVKRVFRYCMAHRIRRFTAAGVVDRRHDTETLHPFYAAELFAVMEALPLTRWRGGAAYWELLCSLDDEAARVPWARTGQPYDAPAEARAAVARSRQWERRWDRLLRNLRLGGRWDPRRFHDVGYLLRTDPASRRFLQTHLAPERLAAFPFLSPRGVRAVLRDHLRGRRDNSTLLGRLLGLSLWVARIGATDGDDQHRG